MIKFIEILLIISIAVIRIDIAIEITVAVIIIFFLFNSIFSNLVILRFHLVLHGLVWCVLKVKNL